MYGVEEASWPSLSALRLFFFFPFFRSPALACGEELSGLEIPLSSPRSAATCAGAPRGTPFSEVSPAWGSRTGLAPIKEETCAACGATGVKLWDRTRGGARRWLAPPCSASFIGCRFDFWWLSIRPEVSDWVASPLSSESCAFRIRLGLRNACVCLD